MAPLSNLILLSRLVNTIPQNPNDHTSLDIQSDDSPPHKKLRRPNKQEILEDDETSASDNNAVSMIEDDPASAIDDDLARAWHTNMGRLHRCCMSNNYAALISTTNGDWDFARDIPFAMDSLLPWTKELLSSTSRPMTTAFKNFRCIDTTALGVYACLAIEKDRLGNIVAATMKVGCA